MHNISVREIKKMKFSTIFLASFTSAEETAHNAISTLNNLAKISLEILNSDSINRRQQWKDKWSYKFSRNTRRMRDSFGRCGTTDGEEDDEIEVEYDNSNPCGAIDGLINGYSKWADRYIAACKGQKNYSHQKNRFARWNNMLDKGKGLNLKFIGINRSTKFNFDTKIVTRDPWTTRSAGRPVQIGPRF